VVRFAPRGVGEAFCCAPGASELDRGSWRACSRFRRPVTRWGRVRGSLLMITSGRSVGSGSGAPRGVTALSGSPPAGVCGVSGCSGPECWSGSTLPPGGFGARRGQPTPPRTFACGSYCYPINLELDTLPPPAGASRRSFRPKSWEKRCRESNFRVRDPYKRVTTIDRGPRKRIASGLTGPPVACLTSKRIALRSGHPYERSQDCSSMSRHPTIYESGGADAVRSA
jgi:hypothetical protein